MMDTTEQNIYAAISASDGIKASEIAKKLRLEKSLVNHYLYSSAYMRELCYQDKAYSWHGLIRQARPHIGLGDFSGYYGTVAEFLQLGEEAWLEALCEGCRQTGRNLNDARGLFHSFCDSRETMVELFGQLEAADMDSWEILFELRIKRARHIRIYADVAVVTADRVFSLEFKMKDTIEPQEVQQAAKYAPYMEVIFGPKYDVISALVLTRAERMYQYVNLGQTTAEIPVCSGDMLHCLFEEYLGLTGR